MKGICLRTLTVELKICTSESAWKSVTFILDTRMEHKIHGELRRQEAAHSITWSLGDRSKERWITLKCLVVIGRWLGHTGLWTRLMSQRKCCNTRPLTKGSGKPRLMLRERTAKRQALIDEWFKSSANIIAKRIGVSSTAGGREPPCQHDRPGSKNWGSAVEAC